MSDRIQKEAVAADNDGNKETMPERDLAVDDGQTPGEDMTQELEAARAEAKEHYDKMLRLGAEFENYKKRMERERSQLLKYAEENLLRDLLSVVDNLERALEQGGASDTVAPVVEGVQLTLDGLCSIMEKYGVKPLKSVGEPFDPTCHDALAMEATNTIEPNHVFKEFQKGYAYHDRLLRAAKVIVSQADSNTVNS